MAYTANYDRVRLPDERSGTMLLFPVHDRMSYGLVVQSSQVIRVGDFIAHPKYGHRDTAAAPTSRAEARGAQFSAFTRDFAGACRERSR